MEKTTVYLPAELQAQLKNLAHRQKRPQAEIVREALTRYVVDQPRPWPKSIGSNSDESLDATDAKRWVNDQWLKEYDEKFGPPRADA